jgi:hypothetical protein
MFDSEQQELDTRRGQTAWYMQLVDVRIGHEALGFDYPFNGDSRPVARITGPIVRTLT